MISLADGPKHGYAMLKDIETLAGARLGPGTLYGALARLERPGLIAPLAAVERRPPTRWLTQGSASCAPNWRHGRTWPRPDYDACGCRHSVVVALVPSALTRTLRGRIRSANPGWGGGHWPRVTTFCVACWMLGFIPDLLDASGALRLATVPRAGASRFDKFTQRPRTVLDLAHREALRLGSVQIGPEPCSRLAERRRLSSWYFSYSSASNSASLDGK